MTSNGDEEWLLALIASWAPMLALIAVWLLVMWRWRSGQKDYLSRHQTHMERVEATLGRIAAALERRADPPGR